MTDEEPFEQFGVNWDPIWEGLDPPSMNTIRAIVDVPEEEPVKWETIDNLGACLILDTKIPKSLDTLEKILNNGVSINRLFLGLTPLYLAVHLDDPRVIKFLLDKGADTGVKLNRNIIVRPGYQKLIDWHTIQRWSDFLTIL